jgi:hypothetical protein
MNRNKAITAYHLVEVNKYAEATVGIAGLRNETSVQTFKIQSRGAVHFFMVLYSKMEF